MSPTANMNRAFIERYCSESSIAHKVQRYIKLFVASELVSDVLGFILGAYLCTQLVVAV